MYWGPTGLVSTSGAVPGADRTVAGAAMDCEAKRVSIEIWKSELVVAVLILGNDGVEVKRLLKCEFYLISVSFFYNASIRRRTYQ